MREIFLWTDCDCSDDYCEHRTHHYKVIGTCSNCHEKVKGWFSYGYFAYWGEGNCPNCGVGTLGVRNV